MSSLVFYKFLTSITILVSVTVLASGNMKGDNLLCYQCIRNTNTECSPAELLPCPPISDRCVTHVTKNGQTGFTIKRECGLGPCGFDDVMVNKGLGLDTCDRSKDDYFCVSCCRENGCNKNESSVLKAHNLLVVLLTLMIIMLNIHVHFQPPYVPTFKTF